MKIDLKRALEVLSACGYECDELEHIEAATIEHCAKVCEGLIYYTEYDYDPWNEAVESCVAHLRGLK